MTATSPTIGVFDSGVGGLSVLDALRHRLPRAALHYVGDVAHAPYGDRPETEIVARCERIVEWLAARGASIVVVACNTATVLAIGGLRERWPEIAFIGVEPGVKPAASVTRNGRIAVLATPATARSARLCALIDAHAAEVHVNIEPCPGLAPAIERGVLDGPALDALLVPHVTRLRAADVDTVVLGCTHYPLIRPILQRVFGRDVTLVFSADETAREVSETLARKAIENDPDREGSYRFLTTGDPAAFQTMGSRFLQLPIADVERVSVAELESVAA